MITRRIAPFHTSERIAERLAFLDEKERHSPQNRSDLLRVPHYCSGCPQNTRTKVPEGSWALAGIACHYMALLLNPDQTQTLSQMGGEGVPLVVQVPFTETKHAFANLGDWTYSHSGLLAIRQAIAAKVPITYKILLDVPETTYRGERPQDFGAGLLFWRRNGDQAGGPPAPFSNRHRAV